MFTQFSTKTAQSKMNILVLLAIVLGGTGLLVTPSQTASASHQSAGVWANAVTACAIDEADVSEYSVGRFLAPKAGIVGSVTARCNVENLPVSSGNALQLIYRDPDGHGTAYRVVAKLQQLTNSGAVVTLATVDSNAGPASASFQSQTAGFGHDFNFIDNAYYVEVTVSRGKALQAPAAAIVRIIATVI
jgi:hypothetical protein